MGQACIYLAGQGQAGAGGPLGTLQLDDADESRLQVVIVTGVAQVQRVGLQRQRERSGAPGTNGTQLRAKRGTTAPGSCQQALGARKVSALARRPQSKLVSTTVPAGEPGPRTHGGGADSSEGVQKGDPTEGPAAK